MNQVLARIRLTLRGAAGAALASLALAAAADEPYPSRPVTLVVPFAAGGGTDILARIVAAGLGERLGQTVIVDNRPGASTNIAADKVAKSKPDGYTLLLGNTNTFVVNPLLYKNLSYSAAKDLSLVGMVANFPMLLVVPSTAPVKTVPEFIAMAKAQPGGLSYASPGTGSPHHLAMELLKHRAGLQMVHAAYRGVSPAFPDLLAGRIHAMFLDYAAGVSLIKDGKLRPLAVGSSKPTAFLPELPTMAQSGFPGFDITGWQGLALPAGAPDAVTKKLIAALRDTLADAGIRKRLDEAGLEPNFLAPAAFAAHIAQERVVIEGVIKANNIRAD